MTTTETSAAADEGPLSKSYDAREVESRWYQVWSDAGVFSPDVGAVRRGEKKPYVIMMPPPNVTGTLHMGHALFTTIQDILIRTARMRGFSALWLPGVDHAGIATQTVVERELKRHEGQSRHDLGREQFLERVWAWKEKHGARIVQQMQGMGASADWSRQRFTMDEMCNRAVREVFVRLWDEGLIYRGERLVNWDPTARTALSDEEVEHEEKDGELWRFAYMVKGSDGKPTTDEIVVATTRPETMLGDVAVAVHPEDERYQKLVGKELVHPFFADRKVLVIADDAVDKDFGTGCVKVTPAHDPNDFAMGQRHKLPMINIFTLDATINKDGGDFAGLERYAARKAVKQKLEELGFFRGTQPIRHNVSVSQRSGSVVEPMLSRQFFVKTKPLADKALQATRSGETRILPAFWEKTWEHWMVNIQDWCISRQLWWGHRIPVFYDLQKLDVAIDEERKRKGRETDSSSARASGKKGRELLAVALSSLDDDLVMKIAVSSTDDLEKQDPLRFVQEEDVLDTWFSSGTWPFATLGWPEVTEDLLAFYPGAVLETGSDILFFWVARMVMMGTHLMGKSPFSDVFLHAIVRDAYGKKMSKSEGNAIDPLDVINGIALQDLMDKTKTYPVPEKKLNAVLKGIEKEFPEGIPAAGADGLRFTLSALSAQGRDVKLSIPRAAGYRAFLNKIWNATRFALMRVGEAPTKPLQEVKHSLSLADRWILSRLQRAVEEVSRAIDEYRFDAMANAMYQFFWTELCDVYIEMVKGALDESANQDAREAARTTLLFVLDTSMRLLHPACPFQTEEIWQKLPGRAERHPSTAFCAQARWPIVDVGLLDEAAEREVGLLNDVIGLIRNVRQESGLPPRKPVVVDVICGNTTAQGILSSNEALLARMAVVEKLRIVATQGYVAPKLSGAHATGSVEVVVHLEGLIDPQKEKDRLAREIGKTEKDLAGMQKRFDNVEFVAKAPPEVVAQGKIDITALNDKLARLRAALQRMG